MRRFFKSPTDRTLAHNVSREAQKQSAGRFRVDRSTLGLLGRTITPFQMKLFGNPKGALRADVHRILHNRRPTWLQAAQGHRLALVAPEFRSTDTGGGQTAPKNITTPRKPRRRKGVPAGRLGGRSLIKGCHTSVRSGTLAPNLNVATGRI